MSRHAKVHMGAAKHVLRYLAGTTDFTIVYKKRGFKLTAFSDSNLGNNPDNGKSTSCYIMMLSRAPVRFTSGVQSLTAMSTMEAELVTLALAIKEAVFCSRHRKGIRQLRAPSLLDSSGLVPLLLLPAPRQAGKACSALCVLFSYSLLCALVCGR